MIWFGGELATLIGLDWIGLGISFCWFFLIIALLLKSRNLFLGIILWRLIRGIQEFVWPTRHSLASIACDAQLDKGLTCQILSLFFLNYLVLMNIEGYDEEETNKGWSSWLTGLTYNYVYVGLNPADVRTFLVIYNIVTSISALFEPRGLHWPLCQTQLTSTFSL